MSEEEEKRTRCVWQEHRVLGRVSKDQNYPRFGVDSRVTVVPELNMIVVRCWCSSSDSDLFRRDVGSLDTTRIKGFLRHEIEVIEHTGPIRDSYARAVSESWAIRWALEKVVEPMIAEAITMLRDAGAYVLTPEELDAENRRAGRLSDAPF